MKRVFISSSYDERSREFVRRLREALDESSRFEVLDFAESALGTDPVSQIRSEIQRSDIFVAVFESNNSTVYFELGLALGTGKEVLIVGRELESLPSDLRNLLYVALSGDMVSDLANVLRRLDSFNVSERAKPVSRNIGDKLRTYTADPAYFQSLSAMEFENLIAEWFEEGGFKLETVPAPRDSGVDLVARSPLDNSLIVVEAKKFSPQSRVSIKDVMALLGAATLLRASTGILVTSSSFTRAAVEMAAESRNPRLRLLTMDELLRSEHVVDLLL